MKRALPLCLAAGLALAFAVGVTRSERRAEAGRRRGDPRARRRREGNAADRDQLARVDSVPDERHTHARSRGDGAGRGAARRSEDLPDPRRRLRYLQARELHAQVRWRPHRGLGAEQPELPDRRLPQRRRSGTSSPTRRSTDLVHEFDTNIYPKESDAFSVPPDRDGIQAAASGPHRARRPTTTSATATRSSRSSTNVRDDNYYDPNNAQALSYIAGFFSVSSTTYFDRNVMTIDAFDWVHRTGANPPNEPVPGDHCTSAPARPYLYEGAFAHEYQHLLEYYEDPDEVNWVNEGLSDWAQTLDRLREAGDADHATSASTRTSSASSAGWASRRRRTRPGIGGPENSLTRWGDQGDGEILCDYGAAYTMMEFLAGPVRRRVHVRAARRRRERPRRSAGRARRSTGTARSRRQDVAARLER